MLLFDGVFFTVIPCYLLVICLLFVGDSFLSPLFPSFELYLGCIALALYLCPDNYNKKTYDYCARSLTILVKLGEYLSNIIKNMPKQGENSMKNNRKEEGSKEVNKAVSEIGKAVGLGWKVDMPGNCGIYITNPEKTKMIVLYRDEAAFSFGDGESKKQARISGDFTTLWNHMKKEISFDIEGFAV
jgi:hypothetical protein